ncbi:uncharacterized protein LOC142544170 [Primulina tabacum]|uniref:uncharacterized protein LOC142544170 n=1 Tax=Primulina tabacum TaxID=48773 RepID=UPI003F593A00
MNDTRSWMYHRLENGFITNNFFNGVEEFVNFAKMDPEIMCGETIRCPCNHRRCRNRAYHDEEVVKLHLCRHGFVPGYYRWHHHGETYITPGVEHWIGSSSSVQVEHVDHMQNMVHDIYNSINIEDEPQSPNETAKNLYDMLTASEAEIWEGNLNGHSQLSVVARLLNMKAKHHISERCYDDLCQLISELLSTENCMTNSFYDTKKLIKGLGLPVEKIDCCRNNCMIYWRDDFDLQQCRFCGHPRYKPSLRRTVKKKKVPWNRMYYFPLTSRFQRLHASVETAKHMRWHSEHVQDGDAMCHPSDSPAWKNFDTTHPDFALEV